jgi:four helix bundle protein
MAKIQHFEDLQSWQKARELSNAVYQITLGKDFSRDYDLRNQIRRAASSVMHNIAKEFDSGSDAEFARFLRIARRSSSEVQSQLYLALDQKYITQEQFDLIYTLCNEVKKLINGFLRYLNKE